MKLRLLSIAISCLLFSSTGFADIVGDSGNDGGVIPDNSSSGYVSTVTITDSEIIQNATFSIEGLTHSWIGDLTITVAHSTSGKTATLLHRVGMTSSPSSTGDSSDVNGTYMFQDGNGSIWSEAALGDSSYVVRPGVYSASGMNEAIVSLDSIFSGELTNGDWSFTISDNNATQIGSFVQTSVEFGSVAVPEPGSMTIVVAGILVGGFGFRHRRPRSLS